MLAAKNVFLDGWGVLAAKNVFLTRFARVPHLTEACGFGHPPPSRGEEIPQCLWLAANPACCAGVASFWYFALNSSYGMP